MLDSFKCTYFSSAIKASILQNPQLVQTISQAAPSMSSSSSGLDPAIKKLSLKDPRCNNDSCLAFQAAHNLSQAQVSYSLQFQYGHWVAWYYSAIIGVGAMVHFYHLYKARYHQRTSASGPSLLDKARAIRRYFSYRRFHGALGDRLGLPAFGLLAFLLTGVLFLFILTFAVRPYYRQHRGYGSPPLAIRTGLMAASLTPLLMALSGKANLVTLVTGLGHEKLNIFHRWVGWSIFGLSVAHTIPFIVAPLHDGGYAALHKQFYEPGGFEVRNEIICLPLWLLISVQYTGVPALAILFGIVVLSLPYVRHRIYETFYFSHFFLAVTYLGLCFWHFGQEGDSWAYLWATLALWLASILGRVFYHNQSFKLNNRWLTGCPTRLWALPDRMTKIDVLVPSTFSWRPAQHCFLRFPSLSVFDNHPFTIASIPQSASHGHSQNSSEMQTMSFFVRSHAGFTRKLSCYTSNNFDGPMLSWVDGPYGGVSRRIEHEYDTIILVAGGTGITSCLPWLQYISQKMNKSPAICTASVKLLWVMRDAASLGWVSQELENILDLATEGAVMLELFVTGPNQPEDKLPLDVGKVEINADGDENPEKGSRRSRTISGSGLWHFGRPKLVEWIPKLLTPGRNVIIGSLPRDDLVGYFE